MAVIWVGTGRFGRPWTFADIATAAWYQGSDASTVTTSSGLVTEWRDKSGNNRHIGQANNALRPAYTIAGLNGRNTVEAPVGGRALVNTTANLLRGVSGWSVIMLASSTNAAAVQDKPFMQIQNSATASRVFLGENGSNRLIAGGRRNDADAFAGVTGGTDPGRGFNILSVVADYSTTTIRLFLNGVLHASSTSWLTSGATPVTGGAIGLFNVVAQDNSNMTGAIAETVVVESAISDLTRQRAEGRVAHDWGVTSLLAVDHPFKDFQPVI